MSTEVIIVGAGPNGLLMAGELALAGVRPIVLECLPEPATFPKANGLVGRVVQALDYRGLYERITQRTEPPVAVPYFQFGALPLDMSTMDNNSMYMVPVPQQRLEELLRQRAHELDVEIRRGHEVTALSQHADGVTVDVRAPEGFYQLSSKYLVGADGGKSIVRKRAGIDFPGITDDSFVGRSGRVTIRPPVAVPGTGELDIAGMGRLRPATFHRTEHGLFMFGMFQPGVYSVGVHEWGRPPVNGDIPVTVTELRDAVCRVVGSELPMSELADGSASGLRRSTSSNSRQADRYRDRGVFLVGDAAHVHSGIGGPGLNLGMQDVLNLAWKLAAEINGWAPAGLLDTYQRERYPVGERVIMHSRTQTALLSPGPNITAVRELFGELLQDRDNVRRISDLMAGADIRYDMGSGGSQHPLTGGWMPDLVLRTGDDQVRVAELMRRARPILLDLAGTAELANAAEEWVDRVDVVAASCPQPPADAVLIRPDGYVAWAGNAAGVDGLLRALRMWFGEPA